MAKNKDDGFIINFAACCVAALQSVSAVELWKQLGQFILRRNNPGPTEDALRRNANVWVDWYIALKWLVVIALLITEQGGWIALAVVSYLLFFNAFSYFYYHGWGSDYKPPKLSRSAALHRDRRRLVSFLLAVQFSFLGFAYLYAVQIPCRLYWPTEPNWLDAIYLSISNSFTLTYDGFQPRDQIARGVLLLQLLNIFVFLTVLIGNAIPSVGRHDSE